MLQKIGDSLKGKKTLAYVILIPLALVFAVWGAAGAVNLDFFGPANWAAKVDGRQVPLEQVNDAWRDQQSQWQQRFGTDVPEAERQLLQDRLLEQFIRQVLVEERTQSMGYRVPTAQVEEYIRNEPAFQVDGKFSENLALARLAQIGVSVDAYRADVRNNLRNQELQRALTLSDFRTPLEVERALRIEDEQREIRYALLPIDKFAASVALDDTAVKAYYDRNLARFQTPETVRLQFAELRLDQVAASVQVAESDLQGLYAKNRDRYVDPEKRRPRHILVTVEAGNDAAALKLAEQVAAEARAPGADFAALARKYSKDAGSAQQGGDLGWSERSAFVGPFSDAVFAMKEGEVRGPVKTEFGYHVIRLDGVQASRGKSYEEARTELESEFRRDRAADLFGEREEQAQRRLEEPGADFAKLASELGLSTGEVAEFARGAGGPPLGADANLEEVVFGDAVLNQRRIGGPVALGEDRFVIVRVLDHRKPVARPLAEVREQVVAALRRERGAEAAKAAAEAGAKRVAAGESLEVVAKSVGVAAEPARFVGRADPAVPAQVVREAFDLPRPQPGKPEVQAIPVDAGGAAIIVVTQARQPPADSAGDPRERAQRVMQMAGRSGSGDVVAYVGELRRRADVEKNPKAFE
ncbi:MAG: peptidyl-prolyl cis-trans isomerase [Steroidobacteraceae bacterium]|jgi:peptidyl-prolyl cis-trans isomerase D|nr:peptidyl-prolyl cis-trans isomerase [Steroidobacteraceae bacterium]